MFILMSAYEFIPHTSKPNFHQQKILLYVSVMNNNWYYISWVPQL